MKKFVFLIMACVAMLMASCDTQFGIAYGVSLTGDGDGKFEVAFPQGTYAMDGTAVIALNIGDTIPFGGQTVTTKAEVIAKGDSKELEALQKVNKFVASDFSTTEGGGTYDLWLKGFIKETGTGLIFEVDRHFTNRLQGQRLAANPNDPYPFIK